MVAHGHHDRTLRQRNLLRNNRAFRLNEIARRMVRTILLMKAHCLKILIAAVCAISLTQCQFPSLADSGYRTIEEKTVTINGHRYVQERRLVSEHPLETQLAVYQVR